MYGIIMMIAFALSLAVLLLTSVFYIISVYRRELNGRFESIRCNPVFMPFVTIINPEVSASENQSHCVNEKSKNELKRHFTGVSQGISEQSKATALFQSKASDLTTGHSSSLTQIKSFLDSISSKVKAATHVSGIVGIKIGTFFEKIGALVVVCFNFLMTLLNMMKFMVILPRMFLVALWVFVFLALVSALINLSIAAYFLYLWLIPKAIVPSLLGAWALALHVALIRLTAPLQQAYDLANERSYCCFAPQTMIAVQKFDEVRYQAIRDIQPGQSLGPTSVVLGRLDVVGHKNVSDCDGIFVSADHYVYKNKTWQHAGGSLAPHPPARLCCLVTSNNRIICRSPKSSRRYLFTDYEESRGAAASVARVVMDSLKCYLPVQGSFERGECDNVLSPDVWVAMCNGNTCQPHNIKIGDRLANESVVVGIYRGIVKPKCVDMDGLQMNARQIYWSGVQWKKVYHDYAGACSSAFQGPFYHFITTHGTIPLWHARLGQVVVRDFLETNDPNAHAKIDTMIAAILKYPQYICKSGWGIMPPAM